MINYGIQESNIAMARKCKTVSIKTKLQALDEFHKRLNLTLKLLKNMVFRVPYGNKRLNKF